MIKEKVLSGQRFGRWTVLDDFISIKRRGRKWLCRCDCGTERYVMEQSLLAGISESCGCLRKEKFLPLDLAGQVFGDLTVVKRVENSPSGNKTRWLCQCSCGEEYVVEGTRLVSRGVTHCPNPNAHRDQRKFKTVDITGQKFKMLTALYPIEKTDNKIRGAVWHCRCDCGNEVDISHTKLVCSSVVSCGCRRKEHSEKLREAKTYIAGTSLEALKSQTLSTRNTTGYKGVYFIRGRYTAKIVFRSKSYYLGSYSTPEEASKARKEAEAILFDGTAKYIERWQKRAEADPEWANANPISIQVGRDSTGALRVSYSPPL
jgi:hypothetical protein